MKIAVIGSGISGLTAAWLLQPEHEVTVFEADPRLGGHTATRDVEVAGEHYAIDTGFIVYNDRTYPNFIRLLQKLGIEGQKTQMSFAVRCEATGLEYCGSNLNTLYAQRSNLVSWRFQRMVTEILRFNRAVPRDFADGLISEAQTLGGYLDTNGYSEFFRRYYILAMVSAIWSSSLRTVADFPMPLFVRFFSNHGLLQLQDRPQWYSIPGGSRRYIDSMQGRLSGNIRLRSPVSKITRHPDHVEIETPHERDNFDYAIIATHSDQALGMLADPSAEETSILGSVPWEKNEVVLHTDSSLLPRRNAARAAWNYVTGRDSTEAATLTYDMNCLQNIQAPVNFCVSLNDGGRVDEKAVLGQWTYAHPVYTPEAVVARNRRNEISGKRRTFYCGAWWKNGFHEDGVCSALDVAEFFGASL